ncbi:MAG: hypothetical protein KUG78_06510 [Kangiellaceae bacterium]|nr:hypothetical protein [Kangiellaceae bacterium]
MNTVDLSWVLAAEIALPFIVLTLVLTLMILSGRKKNKEAARLLILSVKSSEDAEKQAIINYQQDKLSIDGSLAKKNAKKIINERKFLIRNLVSGLLDKNVEAISQLNQDLSRITARYHQLEVSNGNQAEELEEVKSVDSEDNSEELRAEIKSLKQEVHITLTTLNNIFKEFSSMFGEDDIPDNQMTVDQIITAMESFSGKNPDVGVAEEASDVAENLDELAGSEDSEGFESETSSENGLTTDTSTDSKVPESDSGAAPELPDTESTDVQEELPSEESINSATSEESSIQNADDGGEELDFSIDSAIDDIDSALDGLELDATDDEEPDWGDAFAESGDKMEDDPK